MTDSSRGPEATPRSRKRGGCPVEGCKYPGKGPALEKHLRRKADAVHRVYREARSIPDESPKRRPAVVEEPFSEVSGAATPADGGEVPAAEIRVDFGEEPVVEPLVTSPAAASDAGAPGGPAAEPFAPYVVDEPPSPAPAASAGPAPPSVADLLVSPVLRFEVTRFVRGATNRWLLDAELGDRPVSDEEIASLGLPEKVAYTLAWLERKYGWRIDLDHPLVIWSIAVAEFGALVMQHRAERPAQEPAASAAVREEPPGAASSVPESSAAGAVAALEAVLR